MAYDFRKINWGADEAKGDPDLPDYFYQVDGFDEILDGDIRYVIGRKGAGKTAIVERVKALTTEAPLGFYSELSLRDFPVNSFSNLQDRTKTDKSKYVSAWEFIICVELACLVFKDHGALPSEAVADLAHFLEANRFNSDVGFAETVTYLNSTKFKVSAKASWVSGEYGNDSGSEQLVSVHYTKVVKALRERLVKIHSDSIYRIFFDELDEGYSFHDDRLKNILLALIRAVENTALFFKSSGFRFFPLLVLRSDIHDSLEDNDLNKIHDYSLRLRWSINPEVSDNGFMSLRSVVNSRISASFKELKENTDPWFYIANDSDASLPSTVSSVWKYISNRTFERPRDILKFLKLARKHQRTGMLGFGAVSNAEIDYSDWFYGEIRDELQSHLNVWSESLSAITRLGKGKFTVQELIDSLMSDKKVVDWLEKNSSDAIDIIAKLFRFGVVGNLDNNKRWLFGYKDWSIAFDPSMDLIVHYGLHKKLRLGTKVRDYLDFEVYV